MKHKEKKQNPETPVVEPKEECACDNCDCKECECKDCDCEQLAKDLANEKEARMTLLADFVNYRKRVDREKEDLKVMANKVLLHQVIDIVDDFDRAVNLEQDKVDLENDFYQGILLIQKKLADLLGMYGLDLISVEVGSNFDSAVMEAVATAPVSNPEQAGKVMHIVGKGYKNKETGQVFKAVKVITGK